MSDRVQVIDGDGHVYEGMGFVTELMRRYPDQVDYRRDGIPGIMIEGRPYPQSEGPGAGCPGDKGLTEEPGADPTTAAGILADADKDGLDQLVLYPSFAMCVPSIEDPALGVGVARMYNDWAAALVAEGRGRLHAGSVLPAEHVDRAVEVMTEAKSLGLCCAVIPPALRDRNLDHPDLDVLYSTAVELDMALGIHGAPGVHLPKIGVDRFTNYIQVHCVSFPFDQMTAMTAMVSGGVFDRHPRLRVAFLEAGCGWLPWFIERLGEHYESRGDWIEGGWQRHPSEYLAAGNIMVTCEPDEAMLPAVIEQVGDRCVMFASDYPHWDGAWPESSSIFLRQKLAPGPLARVASLNAAELYGLD